MSVPTVAELLEHPERAREVPPEVAAALVVRIAPVQAALQLRALAHQLTETQAQAEPPGETLTAAEVAGRLRVPRAYVA